MTVVINKPENVLAKDLSLIETATSAKINITDFPRIIPMVALLAIAISEEVTIIIAILSQVNQSKNWLFMKYTLFLIEERFSVKISFKNRRDMYLKYNFILGQCKCRPHIGGRRCDEIEDGYYTGALDYLLFEAETAQHSGVSS